jgi:hypothetical protein
MPDLTIEQLATLLFGQKLMGIGPLASASVTRQAADHGYDLGGGVTQSDLYQEHYWNGMGGEAGVLSREQRDAQDAAAPLLGHDNTQSDQEFIDRVGERQDDLRAQRAEQVAQIKPSGAGTTGGGGTAKRL